jgi:type IV pilus assembly protein PilN
MIKINLLPHREAKRKLKKTAFMALLAASAVIGVVIVLVVGAYNATRISIQNERNRVIKLANIELDGKIKQIATLKQEIESLKARQQAVEDLQGDRNQPVFLMDELVRQTPTGVYLKSFKQDGQKVTLLGYAQSQERVAELLRNLASNSPWLERPDLGEVKSVSLAQIKTGRKVVEFNLAATIKRPRDKEAAALAEKEAAAKAARANKGKPAPVAPVPASVPAGAAPAAAPAAAAAIPAAAPAAAAAAPAAAKGPAASETGKPK